MRALVIGCALLLLANVTLFLWPASAYRAAHVYAPRDEVNPHFIRLNKEIEDRHAAQLTQLKTAQGSGRGDICYRLGPFMDASTFELAQAVLFNASVDFTESSRESRESPAYRVYLGPFDSRAAAVDQRTELRRVNVLDNFVRQQNDGSYIVSLGIYTTSATANNAVQLFADRLPSVKMQQENVFLPASQWLHFSADGNNGLTSQLEQMDWGEQSAKMGRYPCSEG